MPAYCTVIGDEGTLSGLIFYEAKEECEEGGTPRSPFNLPGDVRVTCDVLVAPLVQLTLIMDPRVLYINHPRKVPRRLGPFLPRMCLR